MSKEIKFRVWHPISRYFSHWGFIERGMFAGIPSSNEDGFTMEYVKENSQQFTGLHDKNGKEIYEGDIVHCGWFYGDDFGNEVGEMEYSNQVVKYVVGIQGAGFDLNVQGMKYCEVIGNIYEVKK